MESGCNVDHLIDFPLTPRSTAHRFSGCKMFLHALRDVYGQTLTFVGCAADSHNWLYEKMGGIAPSGHSGIKRESHQEIPRILLISLQPQRCLLQIDIDVHKRRNLCLKLVFIHPDVDSRNLMPSEPNWLAKHCKPTKSSAAHDLKLSWHSSEFTTCNLQHKPQCVCSSASCSQCVYFDTHSFRSLKYAGSSLVSWGWCTVQTGRTLLQARRCIFLNKNSFEKKQSAVCEGGVT